MTVLRRALVLGLMAGFALILVFGITHGAQAGDSGVRSPGSDGADSNPPGGVGYLTGSNDGDPLDIALAYLESHRSDYGLLQSDLDDFIVTDRYVSDHTGVTHIYLRQRYQGLEVFGANANINVAADGSVIDIGVSFVPELRTAVNATDPVLTAVQAVEAAAPELGLEITAPLGVQDSLGGIEQATVLSAGGISRQPIPARLVFQPVPDGQVRLAWEIEIDETDADHYWSVRVDARTGRVLSRVDLVDHDAWGGFSGGGAGAGGISEAPAAGNAQDAPSAPDSYRVYAMPSEYPDDGPRVLVTDPADATASPFGWHDTDGSAGAEFTITQGNNVHAYADTDDNDSPDGIPGSQPDGGAGLDFDFPINLGLDPTTYLTASVTNLFYWNNVVHDVYYQYGFDEAAGNFQTNNYGNGGLGNDAVHAEAHDGGGLNNANFLTPPDGTFGRMQMFLWDVTSPRRDGSLENSIVIHEYGHGISNRLTGGPANVFCLDNNEQMGEGWSDWLALVLTAKASDTATTSRGIGTYVLGQPTTGGGIRPTVYTTDMAVNPATYGDIGSHVIPHGVGYVWATMLWDVYWSLVDQYGFNTDFYGNWTTGGNNLAIQLVMDGMKLQACDPGFVDGRDAILLADQALTGGANQCTLWEAFARRGLGYSADQGSAVSTTDGTEAFDMPPGCDLINATPPERDVCVATDAVYEVAVGAAFSPPVDLLSGGEPAGSMVIFNPDPVITVPGTSDMTVTTGGVAAGSYTIAITATDTVSTAMTTVDLNVFDAAPPSPGLTAPPDGATGVDLSPTFEWSAASGALVYELQVAEDAAFTSMVYTATVDATTHTASATLDPLTTYYWRVGAENPCGMGSFSGIFSFTTRDVPPVLLVDDDDNSPDVQLTYDAALGALGVGYDLWDTANSDDEPDPTTLSLYDIVVWFSGDEFGGFAGPGALGEAALATYLDGGGCLLISSQDYHYDRGLTTFMSDYLGVDAVSNDAGDYTSVTGQGSVFGGLGPYSLSYPFSDFSDIITPTVNAELAFDGDNGNGAAVDQGGPVYRTSYWTYPLEAISTPAEREEALGAFLTWCGGTLAGQVTSGHTGEGIPGVQVTADNGTDQFTALTDGNGNYSQALPVGTYTVTATTPDYLSETATAVTIAVGDTTTQDFVLYAELGYLDHDLQAFDFSVGRDGQILFTHHMTNTGNAALSWWMDEAASTLLPIRPFEVPPSGKTITLGDPVGGNAFSRNPRTDFSPSQPASQPVPNVVAADTYTITHSLSQTIQALNSVSCNAGGLHTDNSYMRVFDLPSFGINGDFEVSQVQIGIEQAVGAGGAQPASVNLYTLSGPLVFANLTPIGSANINVSDQNLTILNVPVSGTAPAGSTLVVEFFTPNGQAAGHSLFVGSNNLGQTDPTYLAAADCAVPEPTDTGSLGFPGMHLVMNVTGSLPNVCDSPSDVSWVSVAPDAGNMGVGASTALDVVFNASGMSTGVYTASLCLNSDAPLTPLAIVPMTMTVETANAALSLDVTAGTTPGVCAATGSLHVLPGTAVYYCYEVTNTGNVMLPLHDLVDTEWGTLMSSLSHSLNPGASTKYIHMEVLNAVGTIANSATWTGYDGGSFSADATDGATVVVDPYTIYLPTINRNMTP